MNATISALAQLDRASLCNLDKEVLVDVIVELASEIKKVQERSRHANSENPPFLGETNRGGSQPGSKDFDASQNNDVLSSMNNNSTDSGLSTASVIDPAEAAKLTVDGTSSGYTLEFEQWYKIYPRKAAKRTAFTAFKKAIKRISLAQLMELTAEFAESNQGKAGKLCPHPATFLNQARYEDGEEEWNRFDREFTQKDFKKYDEKFDAFFNNFPNQGNRLEALKEFARLGEDGYDLDVVLAAVGVFKKSPKGKSDRCPSAAAWLKQRWFEDSPARWNQVQKSQTTDRL